MNASSPKTRRVLIVGAKFGEMYLNAFLQDPPGLELAGLLATGSGRAQQLAHAFGIPLYTAIEQLPDNIDIACVVVRSTVVGGTGTALAEAFLRRGMQVVQEHPMHPDEAERLQALAQAQGCAYWINGYYAHTPAGACWIDRARRVRQLLDGETAQFAQLTTSRQLLYSALDLLLQACDIPDTAETVTVDATAEEDAAFRLLRLTLGGCRAALRLQTYLDPRDPDLHSLTMHQLTLGWPSGYLSLEASHGPVLWTSALYDPHHHDTDRSLYRGARDPANDPFARPSTQLLHPAPPDWRHAFEVDGPSGVGRVLQLLGQHLDGAPVPSAFRPEYQLTLARLWQQTLRCAGPAHERSLPAPRLLDPRELATLLHFAQTTTP
ncbi:thiazolinyl reductase component of yersiniabactin synthetase [Xanthomonas arboricola]|uniref:Gfo/Idh/MocA family oxidoreductase n=1 Tax=Xanthomonas TaxID=338 RepID=UPI000CEF3820|nr:MULTISPECIES: Gfo/Idh/MocA family oxidoreductase [Xanthomonas]MBB5736255.1 thiazolinyl reductase component of yersiniabactin synthetase [Xanthomonas sp. CFBP 8152]PPT75928.1 thiazolinyl imide reductase [Xanthomonas arboricola]